MLNTMTRTYDATGNGINKLDVEIRYEKGGWSYMTGRESQRGYYFSVTPYEEGGMWRSYRAFSGAKTCVLPCGRQSKKRFEEACAMMDDLIERFLPAWLEENGVTISDEYTVSVRDKAA